MNWKTFLIRLAGKVLIFVGVIVAVFDLTYDTIVGREGATLYFGPLQALALTFCFILIFIGYLLNTLRKSEGEWTWEIGDGSFGEWLWHLIAIFVIPIYWIVRLFTRHRKNKSDYKSWK